MAFIPSKGSLLQQQISNTFTTIAQLISVDCPEMKAETAECDTLDNNSEWIPHMATGRTEPGELSFECFFDQSIYSSQLALLTANVDTNYQLVYNDGSNSKMSFTGAGFGMSGGTLRLNDGIKGKGSIKIDGPVTFS